MQEIELSLYRAEKAEQNAKMLSKYKTDFLSNMSHELRTPMASILGFTDEIIQDDTSREEMQKAAAYIRRSGDHLLGILNDVLDIA